MAKVSSRTGTSKAVKQVPPTAQNNADQPGTVSARQQGKPSVNASEYDPHADAIVSGKLPSASDTSETGRAPKPVDRQYLLGMTEEEGLQVYEARCMLKLLEDMALFAEREITISRGSLVVMMAVIREKLSFAQRFLPMEDEELFEDQE